MKNNFLIISLSILIFASCKQTENYSVEIDYTVSGLKGDSILTNKQTYFTVPNDSMAYLKGAQDFANARLQKVDTTGTPTKFSVRNKKGDLILKPVFTK